LSPKYAVSWVDPENENHVEIDVMEAAASNDAERKEACDSHGKPSFAQKVSKRFISIYQTWQKNGWEANYHPEPGVNHIARQPKVDYKDGKLKLSTKYPGFDGSCELVVPVTTCK
jgi:hypothetical protein